MLVVGAYCASAVQKPSQGKLKIITYNFIAPNMTLNI